MKSPWSNILLVAIIAAASQTANAHEQIYLFHLSGAAEAPPVVSAGTGRGIATFDLDMVTMRIEIDFSGLTGLTTASHIHCCDFNSSGNAGVATQTPSFTGFPLNVTAGTYDHTFDMALASSYRAAYLTAHGGSVVLALNDLLANLDAGKAYLNIHTNSFPSGEIRGLAIPVPEPTCAVLALVGMGMPMLLRRVR